MFQVVSSGAYLLAQAENKLQSTTNVLEPEETHTKADRREERRQKAAGGKGGGGRRK